MAELHALGLRAEQVAERLGCTVRQVWNGLYSNRCVADEQDAYVRLGWATKPIEWTVHLSGLSQEAVLKRGVELGLDPARRRQPGKQQWTQAQIEEAQQMIADGKKLVEVAEATGRTYRAVVHIIAARPLA